jgi:hypothetical protein
MSLILKSSLALMLVSCAQMPAHKTYSDDVSLGAALDQAQMSYLRGCVEAFRSLQIGPSFEACRDKAKAHRLELNDMVDFIE